MSRHRVDGFDPVAVRDAAAKAVEAAREGVRPYLLEVITERLRGHSVVDPAKYRPPRRSSGSSTRTRSSSSAPS